MIHLFGEDRLKAVAYYRHSAEDKQENSVEIQREQVEKFADTEGVEIIEHFQDEGFTGITDGRPGFQAMFNKWIRDPLAPKIDYILVYDASRFGRFQKIPVAMNLLMECNGRGVNLGTVNRGLPKKETTAIDYLILILDFAAAGEYSKLLGDKVIFGCIKVSEQGYSAGGMAPYGYVRVLLSESRERLGILKRGEHKIISNQRVTFEPKTNGEAEVVKRIFKEFVDKGLFPDEIALKLNKNKTRTACQKEWSTSGVIRILSNETYTGTRVYNKTWGRLKQKKRRNPSDEWTRCLNAHTALVDEQTFRLAQERLHWLRPRVRNQTTRRYLQAESYVKRFISSSLSEFNEDQQFYIRNNFPVAVGTTYKVGDKKRSCFYLPNQVKKYGKLLAVSIDNVTEETPVENIYLIDTWETGYDNFLVLTTGDKQGLCDLDEINKTVNSLSERVLNHHSPWLITDPELATSITDLKMSS